MAGGSGNGWASKAGREGGGDAKADEVVAKGLVLHSTLEEGSDAGLAGQAASSEVKQALEGEEGELGGEGGAHEENGGGEKE